jgi:protein SCO1/2
MSAAVFMAMDRRRLVQLVGVGFSIALLGGCENKTKFHGIDVSGTSPSLAFTMNRTPDGSRVTERDYRGQIVMLYLGYTFCPDVCPTTLAAITRSVADLGANAGQVTVLFVTVDPRRDTLPILTDYVRNFGPRVIGLRGTPDELAALARRYRLLYSVRAATKENPYEVSHSPAVYIFDGSGAARVLVTSLASQTPDISGVTADLRRLIAATGGAVS